MSVRLRELIRAVRACKTAADEREVIAKESAAIRTAFKDEDSQFRHRNVAKLLFIHMLGYPTHFGHMECLKLIASAKFPEKRIGYLGLMLLLDESTEVLMLVTNSLQNDMRHSSQYVAGLALCALGDIGSADICRDLCPEVEKLTSNSNSYIRKKAALCAIRIVRKCPEMIENFVERIPALLSDRNHGVLVSALSLLIEICDLAPSLLPKLRKQNVAALVRMLKNLVLSGFAPEHDVDGITDPFLQVKCLRSLRLLGAKDAESSELMTDILASVATNTEGGRNAGVAILYECVLTIMGIESDKGLRVLAVNILGRFLTNRDNNVRYVALNTLAVTCAGDISNVQRHRNTVLDCLKDPDVSIRRRALELLYLLVNETNVKQLVRELLNFLMVAGPEFKADLTEKICTVVNRYPPSKKWQVDMLVKVLVMAGEFVSNEIGAGLVQVISSAPELQIYSVHKFFHALSAETLITPKKQLVKIGVWVIGEYGELLSIAPPRDEGEDATGPVSEKSVIDLIESILHGPLTTLEIKKYSLTAMMKLTTRLDTGKERIQKIIDAHRGDLQIEMQQRACEYWNVFDFDDIRRQLLEHMPTADDVARDEGEGGSGGEPQLLELDGNEQQQQKVNSNNNNYGSNGSSGGGDVAKNIMDDLFGLDLGGPPAPVLAPISSSSTPSPANNLQNLIASSYQHPPQTQQINNLLTPSPALGGGVDASGNPLPIVAFQQQGLTVRFEFVKHPSNPALTQINASFTNSNVFPISNFVFQAAVPKFAKLQMNPASGTDLAPNGGQVTQMMRINNSMFGQKTLAMRLKFDFVGPTGPVSLNGEVPSLPPSV